MAKVKCAVDGLNKAINGILSEYAYDIGENVDVISEEIAKETCKKLKSASRSTFKQHDGKYAKGWTTTQTRAIKGSNAYTVHNKYAGMPHLLENGHANRNGGFTSGRSHIAPIEAEAVSQFTKNVKGAIQNG